MEITIKRTTGWDVALDSALFTINKEEKHKQPSDKWIAQACLSEHSMLRDVRYIVEIKDIPCWVSQHIARHDAFAWHYVRESGETHFVGTSRTDRTGVNRDELKQSAPVNHRISLSAQDFINISQRRLCRCASVETRKVWEGVIDKLKEIDPVLASKCVPSCVYRGFCPEFKSCGYANSNTFQTELNNYRNTETIKKEGETK